MSIGAQLDVVTDRGRTQHAEVKGAGAQVLALVRSQHVGLDLQRDAGQFALDHPGDAGQMREGRGPFSPNRTRPLRPAAMRRAPRTASSTPARMRVALGLQELTGSGQRHLPGGAGEQRGVEFGLQLPDRVRQRRLCDMKLLRGLSEMAGLGHGDEIPQVT